MEEAHYQNKISANHKSSTNLARKHGNVLELFLFLLVVPLPKGSEVVKEMVDDVGLEYLDVVAFRHLLSIFFHLDVKGQDAGKSGMMLTKSL